MIPKRQFPIRPFLFDNLLFDGATRSPLWAKALPFSKQLPANDTQMAKDFVAAAPLRSVSPSELFAPRHSLKTIRAGRCGGWERWDTGLIRSSRRSVPPRTDEGAVWRGCQNTGRLFNQQTRLRCMFAHTITGTDCLINSSPGYPPIIIYNCSILSDSISNNLICFYIKQISNWVFFGGAGGLETNSGAELFDNIFAP